MKETSETIIDPPTKHAFITGNHDLEFGLKVGQLCQPCYKAMYGHPKDGFSRIGTSAWVNNGYEGYENVTNPVIYCCFCRYILRARELAKKQGTLSCELPEEPPIWFFYDMDASGIFLHDDGVNINDNDDELLKDFEVQPSKLERTVNRHSADITMIRRWLHNCENDHGDRCNKHRKERAEPGELLLVDVELDCLIYGSFDYRYFALSYVWGSSQQFLTLLDNFGTLRKPGSLCAQPLTQTIRDSMSFVKSIGERYLWIDAICIVQNDKENKASAIAQMCSIYSRAVATIIAVSGDSADAGLPGIPPTSRNTVATCVAPGLHLAERTTLQTIMATDFDYRETECVYSTRAWTFQERLLSNRSIMFLQDQVYFQCKKELRCEDRNEADTGNYDIWTLDNVHHSHHDLFYWYDKIVSQYSEKKMGYMEDIMNAFQGVQADIQNTSHWMFHEGLPIPKLDQALLWTPMRTLRRRVTAYYHPSWCWSGWIGGVRYSDILHPEDNIIKKDTFCGTVKKSGNSTGLSTMMEFELFQPLGFRSFSGNDTILFDGGTVKLKAFSVERIPKGLCDPATMHLFSENSYYLFKGNQRCGLLIGTPDNYNIMTAGNLTLVRLSRWKRFHSRLTHGPRIGHFSEDKNMWDECLFDPAFNDDEWCTGNVMLVRPVGDTYERVAVGMLHENAFFGASPEWKVVAVR